MFENLSLFARLTMFAGMFFASVPGLIEGGDGGGAGGGDEGGGDGGDGGDTSDEGGEGGTSETSDEGVSDEDDVSGGGDNDHDEDDGDSEGEDGKKVVAPSEAQFRKALDEVKKVDPKLADILRKDHYSLGDYKKIGSLNDIRALKETVEDLGGEEGISTMRGKVVDYANELMRFAEGDPTAVDDLFKDYAEGGFKLVPMGVNKMKALEMDEATGLPKPNGHYARLQARLTDEALATYGADAVIEDLIRIAHDGGVNAQQRTIDKLALYKQWRDGVRAFARRPSQDQATGDRTALDKERQEVAQEKRGIYLSKVGSAVTQNLNSVVQRFLNPKLRDYLKATGKPLKLASKQDVFVGISTRISKALENNSRYQTQVKAMIAAGDDAEKIGRFCKTYIEKLAQKATDGVWETKGHSNARRGKVNAGAGAGTGRVTTGKKPEASKIDWSKDPSRMRFIRGEATLKKEFGGGIVKWDATAL